MPAKAILARFLTAVEERDVGALVWHFEEEATWRNMPGPPAVGRAMIGEMFDRFLPWCERVVWDIVSASYTDDTAWVERVDRFWVDGREFRIECNGVFVVDLRSELITEVRDYVDLGVWRTRLSEGGFRR